MPSGKGFAGSSFYAAPNPPFGATITYHLKEKVQSLKEQRQKAEKKGSTDQPTVEAMRAELQEQGPSVLLTIRDDAGQVVRRMKAPRDKGMHRVAWNLRYPTYTPTTLKSRSSSPWAPRDVGPLALPGTYTATLSKVVDGETTTLADPVEFEVVPLNLATFSADDRKSVLAFQQKVGRMQRAVQGAVRVARETQKRINFDRQAILDTPGAKLSLLEDLEKLQDRLHAINLKLTGDRTRSRLSLPTEPSILSRVENIVGDQWWVSSPPTHTQRDQYGYASDAFKSTLKELRKLAKSDLTSLEKKLENAGAAWTPGRIPDWKPE